MQAASLNVKSVNNAQYDNLSGQYNVYSYISTAMEKSHNVLINRMIIVKSLFLSFLISSGMRGQHATEYTLNAQGAKRSLKTKMPVRNAAFTLSP